MDEHKYTVQASFKKQWPVPQPGAVLPTEEELADSGKLYDQPLLEPGDRSRSAQLLPPGGHEVHDFVRNDSLLSHLFLPISLYHLGQP